MKSKKITALLLASAMVFSLASCNMPGKRDRDDDDERIERTEDEETTKETTEETTEETTTTESETEATAAKREAFEGKVVDFDDMHFFVNGKKYTLGKSTLKEMIDDGVPFEASDIKHASEDMKKNARSLTGFRITLDKFWSAQVGIMNLSDSAKPMSECVICSIRVPSIESKYNNGANLAFDFPMDLTMEELVANAGEPEGDNKKHYEGDNGYYTDTYTYKQKAKKYIGSKSFEFEFKKGEITSISINYLP